MTKSQADRVEFTSNTSLEVRRILPGPIERVWAYLVDPELRVKWFCGGVVGEKPGDEIVFDFDHSRLTDTPPPPSHEGATPVLMTGTVVAFDPPRRLQFAWPSGEDARDSLVTIELTDRDDGRVELRLTHERVDRSDHLRGAAAGWHAHLDLLGALMAGDPIPDFWTVFNAMDAEYGVTGKN